MNDAFTAKLYNIYANDSGSCMQLMGYLAENPNERQTLKDLQSNDKAFKQYADALLMKAGGTTKHNSESSVWNYFSKKLGKTQGFAVSILTCGAAGAFMFGPWGAPSGAAVGGVVEGVRQQYLYNDMSQDLKDAYAFLGISPSATNEEVDKAYREKSRIYHPDRAGVTDAQSQLNSCVQLIRNSRGNKANHEEFEIVSQF